MSVRTIPIGARLADDIAGMVRPYALAPNQVRVHPDAFATFATQMDAEISKVGGIEWIDVATAIGTFPVVSDDSVPPGVMRWEGF